MSVSQVKKQFEEFAAYLGRDAQGLEKLKDLKDAVNVLRTRLASTDSEAAHSAELVEAMTKRSRTAESELATVKSEIQRLQQINQNLSRDLEIAIAKAAVASAEPEEKETNDASSIGELELKRVVKRLRVRLNYCPLPTRIFAYGASKDAPRVWDRESLAKGWSHESLWTLGASLAVLATTFGSVVLESKILLKDVDVRDPEADSSVSRQIFQWIRKMISNEDGVSERLYSRSSGRLSREEKAIILSTKAMT